MDFDRNKKTLELVERLKSRAKARDLFINDDIAQDEIEDALLEYYNVRHFNPTEDEPYESKYASIILQLAISSISKYGAEGETKHNEGGVDRQYENGSSYPSSIVNKIIPLAKGVDM